MTEQELLQEIKKSAEYIQIPDSLHPEYMREQLKAPKRLQKRLHFPTGRAFSAAAVLLLCGILSAVSYHIKIEQPVQNPSMVMEGAAGNHSVSSAESSELSGVNDNQAISSVASEEEHSAEPKQDAGTLYTVAKSYDQVYDILDSLYSQEAVETRDGAFSTGAALDGVASYESAKESYDTADVSEAKKESYSTTNLQTEGVDESDTVKTDGRYIYTLTGARITITDTAGGNLTCAGSVIPPLDAADRILEFYMDNTMLYVLTEHYESSLSMVEPESETTYFYSEDGSAEAKSSDSAGFIPLENYELIDSVQTEFRYSTILYAYDISAPDSPILSGTASQEGAYKTSRKIGTMIYLFTQKTLANPVSYEGKTQGGIIPCVNGEEIPYDHIYTSEEGREGLILSSFDTNNLAQPKDMIMVMHRYADIYVGTDSIYLYYSLYESGGLLSQIAKFSIDDGNINAVNAATVKGGIYDTFAINESNGTLRALTTYTDDSGNTDNHLYLFDKDLNLTGSLTGIAKNEEIYAARYLGNTAYFITYRETDPLFAVDLTDVSNPVLLGQLEVTGFSEYLHFWEDGKLLGLGYETDPKSGNHIGLKLVMFDISNPRELQVIDSLVLTDCHYSPGLYHYKCVLADREKNLIGFSAEYGDMYTPYYDLFSWENGHFVQKLHETLPEYEYISYDSVRGLYIENHFYTVCPTIITGYDMKDNFNKYAELNLSE